MRRRQISNSTIVVAGATSGVGRATALSLDALDTRLVIVARSGADVETVATECRRLGTSAIGVAADISRPDDIDRIVTCAIEEFGGIDT